MKNRTKMIFMTVFYGIWWVCLVALMCSKDFFNFDKFATISFMSICGLIFYGVVYLMSIYKFVDAVLYWISYCFGKEVEITDYSYDVKVKHTKTAPFYSIRPIVECEGARGRGLPIWEFNKDFMTREKPKLTCRVCDFTKMVAVL